MSLLRRTPTSRLLAACAAILLLIAGGTAVASAISGSGPLPPAQGLAPAIHQALSAPAVQGVTARVQFTNRLVDSSILPGKNPLLTGASGRIWLSRDHRLRLELQSGRGDSQLVLNQGSFWAYDASSNTVYRGQLPKHGAGATPKDAAEPKAATHQLPTVAEIQSRLDKLAQHVNVSGAQRDDVAGQPAYTVRVSPPHDGGLLGAGELAFDAARGLPLRFAIYAQGNSDPVLELRVTNISYGPVPVSDFNVSAPHDAKTVDVTTPTAKAADTRGGHARAAHHAHASDAKPVSGVQAVQAALPFKLSAPSTLVGLPQHDVRLIAIKGSPVAIVTYGQGLGGIAVIERAAAAATKAKAPSAPDASQGGDKGGGLPTVSVNGATGHELSTALGTLVTFERKDSSGKAVTYAVVGSVPANAAEAAARAL